MFVSRKSDVKKYVLKLQDYKKDSISKLRYLKIITGEQCLDFFKYVYILILCFVDLELVNHSEAKSIFETNYSHIYYILHETIYSFESNAKQKGKYIFKLGIKFK